MAIKEELLQYRGRLAELRHQYTNIQIECSGLVVQLRMLLNPYTEDAGELKTDQISVSAQRLHKLTTELREVKRRMKEIQEVLGE